MSWGQACARVREALGVSLLKWSSQFSGEPIRVEVAGGLYHVIVWGNERRNVFPDDGDRSRYLTRLAFYREKFSFRVLAYCLMDNHVHPAIETGKIPLSRVNGRPSVFLHAGRRLRSVLGNGTQALGR